MEDQQPLRELHELNRAGWDAVSPRWQADIDARGLWQRAPREPAVALSARERHYLGDVAGRRVCVLGSGDNLVVFALAGLGARVTSVDISQVQLDIAAGRAETLGLDVRFVRADVVDLAEIEDESFDIVYTGGHVAVWVSDLQRAYAEAGRILRPGGTFLVCEYHPFRRLWAEEREELVIAYDYFARGPYQYDRSDEIDAEPGTIAGYEFHYTVADFVGALLGAGCQLLALEEFGQGAYDWEPAAVSQLPEHLLLVGRKG